MIEKKETKKSEKEKSVVGEVLGAVEDLSKKAVNNVEEIVEEVVEDLDSLSKDKDTKKKGKKKTQKKETSKIKEKSALEKLKEKAKALEESVEESDVSKLKEKIKTKKSDVQEEKSDALVPIEDYLKSSIHLGTRVITPDMRPYVYKRRADGLAVFNTAILDDKIKEGSDFLSQYAPEDIILICKREAGWKATKLFSQATGIRIFTKKYPAGILTNTNLSDFTETELIFIIDPWLDKNALTDANNVKVPVLSICDTNNYTQGIKKIIPGNNKSAKSIGMILYLMAKLYVESRKLKTEIPPITEWIDDWDNLTPPK